MFVFFSRFAVEGKENLMFLSFFSAHSNTKRVIKMAVKREERIPIIRVTEKPKIGPVPKANSTKPVRRVVMFESRMADKAFLYPFAMAERKFLPKASSSFTLS